MEPESCALAHPTVASSGWSHCQCYNTLPQLVLLPLPLWYRCLLTILVCTGYILSSQSTFTAFYSITIAQVFPLVAQLCLCCQLNAVRHAQFATRLGNCMAITRPISSSEGQQSRYKDCVFVFVRLIRVTHSPALPLKASGLVKRYHGSKMV